MASFQRSKRPDNERCTVEVRQGVFNENLTVSHSYSLEFLWFARNIHGVEFPFPEISCAKLFCVLKIEASRSVNLT